MPSGVEAGKAYVSLGLKPNMKKGLQAAGQQFKSFGRQAAMAGAGVAAAGTAVLAPLLAATAKFASIGDEIHKMSARTGVGATALSELAFAAEQSGASVADVEKGFFGLSRALFDAAQGSKMPKDALAEIGLTFEELQGLNPEEQFMKIADGIAGIEDVSVRGAVAQKLFGRAGRQMLPMLAEGSAGIKELREEANELGRSLSGPDADAAAEYTDAMNRLTSVGKGVVQQVGAALAPALAEAATAFAHIAKRVVGFIRENRSTIRIVAGVAAAVIGLGGAITALGFTFIGIGAAITGIATALGFILSPLGLIVGGLAAVGFAAEHYFGFISKAIDFVIERFGPLVGMWQDAIGAIVGAIADGNIDQVWAIVMDALEGTFIDLTLGIAGYWDTAMNVMVDTAAGMAKAIANVIGQLGMWIQSALKGYQSYYNEVYNNVTEMIGELSGVRTIGGPVDAFGSTGDFILRAGEGLEDFGSAMADTAEGWRKDNQSDMASRKKEREARLAQIRADLGDQAAEAEAKKQQRKDELTKLKGHQETVLAEAGKGVQNRGTFSIAAAEAMAGGRNTIAQQQLKVQKRNEANTKIIAENTKLGNAAVLA